MIPRLAHRPQNPTRLLESLEERCLLSVAQGGFFFRPPTFGRFFGPQASTVQLSQAPTSVQTGFAALASSDSLAAPSSTQSVYLGNQGGAETYTIVDTGTGTPSRITVDPTGTAVTAPTLSTTTFGAITNTAVTNEITAIATALNLTAPASTTPLTVSTPASGPATYVISLASANSTSRFPRMTQITVDDNGDPTGNQVLPLSVFSTALQTGLTSNAPIGATALTSTSNVTVRTQYGVTNYSATYHATGIVTTVTVDDTGTLADLPSTSSADFSTLTTTVQTALQTYATDAGYTLTISDSQGVSALDEANGTIIYTVRLPVTITNSNGHSYSYSITVSVDENGNPTVLPTSAPLGGIGEGSGLSLFSGMFGGGFGPC